MHATRIPIDGSRLAGRLGLLAVLGFLVTAGLLALGSTTQAATAAPLCDVPDPPPICDPEDRPPPPPPSISPVGNLDVARQTTDQTGIHVVGWAADGDAATTPLSVRVDVDGSAVQTVTADVSRPDVGAAYPKFGSAHGFDVTVPAVPTAHKVCVTAINVGSGGNRGWCLDVDQVVEFNARGVSYDTDQATIESTGLQQLDKVTHTNDTAVEQTTEVSGSQEVTDTHGWTTSFGLKVTANTKVSFFGLADGELTVEGSVDFSWNGSHEEKHTFSWNQPVIVPARSRVDATITITRSLLKVPFTMSGDYVYASGARAPGSIGGEYHGVDSRHLQVKLKQYNLDGTPAARPVDQPPPELLAIR
jgi:Clostridium epsilon toxin ETX/Bacillus mosquitocidal toxin MTX2